jgi:hypothetical protein
VSVFTGSRLRSAGAACAAPDLARGHEWPAPTIAIDGLNREVCEATPALEGAGDDVLNANWFFGTP